MTTARALPSRPATLAVLLVLALQAAVVFVREFPGPSHPVPKDFAQYYVAGLVLREGEPEALYFTDLYTGLTTERFPESRYAQIAARAGVLDSSYYIYPPWVGALYVPFTFVSPYRALVAVYLLSWLMTGGAMLLLARRLPAWGWPAAAATFALLVWSVPFAQAIRAGQASVPVLLLTVLFAGALWRRRSVEAGIWLALLTGIKLFPVLFVPYLVVTRRWKTLAAFAAAGTVLLGFGVGAAGLDAHVRFIRLMQEYLGYSTTLCSNQSVTGFLFRLADPASPRVWSVLPIPPAVAWGARAVNLAALALTLWLAWRVEASRSPWGPFLGLALVTIWVFNAASNVWLHHAVALAVPFAVALAYAATDGAGALGRRLLLWGAAWGGILLYDLYHRSPAAVDRPPWVAAASLPLLGTVMLYVLLASLCREVARERAGEGRA